MPVKVSARIKQKYAGLLDRVTFYAPFNMDEAPKWRAMVKAFR